MSSNNVVKQIAIGSIWSMLMRMSIRFLGIISVIILARVLLPEDYGIVAKAVILSGFLDLVTQFGFAAALIQNQQATKEDYDTVWTLSIIRAILLAVIMCVLSIPLAEYFKEPAVQHLIYVYAISTLIQGFNNVGIVDFLKDMNFQLDFKFNLIKKLVSFTTTIAIAITWETYWAFPIGILFSNVIALFASYILSRYRPTLTFASVKHIFHFSKWMFAYELMGAFSTKMDAFLLGRFTSSESLGLYTMGYEISGMPSTEISMPVARAALPGLSKLNNSRSKLVKTYVDILASTLLLAIPAAAGLSVLAEDIVKLALGENWLSVIPLVQVLAFFGITRVFVSCAVSALIAFKRVDILSKYSLFMLIIKLAILPLAVVSYGLVGATYGVFVCGIIGMLSILIIQHYIGLLNIWLLMQQTWRIITSAIIMYGLLFYAVPLVHSLSFPLLINLIVEITIGMTSFSIILLILTILVRSETGPEKKLYLIIKNKMRTI
ncbi:lipopolysaccharide biosynthesis protein [uncultured Paraglaciecola sp.]|uniref:lipopolysaccharide biosynthesis protein n=1 Tax=uncultured Paraglaciecola sp. TaxID=1765024 RepID=UPI0026343E67|nr:lipopolysaccharide biosynthesis protein [uncultured Paraglaciecola sp.]